MKQKDLRYLGNKISADYKMIALRTKLKTAEENENTIHDIKLFLENNYLREINILLVKNLKTLRAQKYIVKEDINRYKDDRPGEYNNENIGATDLVVVISYSDNWNNLNDNEKDTIRKKLRIKWTSSPYDINYSHLSSKKNKEYTKNTIGVNRIDYE